MVDLLRQIPAYSRIASELGESVRALAQLQEETEDAMQDLPDGLARDVLAAHLERLRRTQALTRDVIRRVHGFCHLVAVLRGGVVDEG